MNGELKIERLFRILALYSNMHTILEQTGICDLYLFFSHEEKFYCFQ